MHRRLGSCRYCYPGSLDKTPYVSALGGNVALLEDIQNSAIDAKSDLGTLSRLVKDKEIRKAVDEVTRSLEKI